MEVAKLVTQPFCRKINVRPAVFTSKSLLSTSMVAAVELVTSLLRGVANVVGVGSGSTYVALEGALENKLLSHVEVFVEMVSTKRRSGGLKGDV